MDHGVHIFLYTSKTIIDKKVLIRIVCLHVDVPLSFNALTYLIDGKIEYDYRLNLSDPPSNETLQAKTGYVLVYFITVKQNKEYFQYKRRSYFFYF